MERRKRWQCGETGSLSKRKDNGGFTDFKARQCRIQISFVAMAWGNFVWLSAPWIAAWVSRNKRGGPKNGRWCRLASRMEGFPGYASLVSQLKVSIEVEAAH